MLPQTEISDVNVTEIVDADDVVLPSKTWRVDFEKKRICDVIDGVDALKQSIDFLLRTDRYKHLIYSWEYGAEFSDLIGTDIDFAVVDAERMTREAVEQDDRIIETGEFETVTNDNRITASFEVVSNLGAFDAKQEIQYV